MPASRYDYRYALECGQSTSFPPDPAMGSGAWFDAAMEVYSDAGGTVPAVNGNPVQNWKSRAGSYGALELKPVGGFGVPTLRTGVINGKPVIRSVAASFDLLRQNPVDAAIFEGGIFNVSQGTVFCVVRQPVNSGSPAAFWGDSGGYIAQAYYEITGVLQAQAQLFTGGATVTAMGAVPNPTAAHILCYHFAAGLLYQGIDEVRTAFMPSMVCGNLDPTAGALVVLGGAGPGQYANGDLAELIFYPNALNQSARMTTGLYLAGKYGIVVPF